MSVPDPRRKELLNYFRSDFGYGKDFVSVLQERTFTHVAISAAVKSLKETDPTLWTVLYTWMVTRLNRVKMSEEYYWSSHSVKRRLNASVDVVMTRLQLGDLAPEPREFEEPDVVMSYAALKRSLLKVLERYHPGISKEILAALRKERSKE